MSARENSIAATAAANSTRIVTHTSWRVRASTGAKASAVSCLATRPRSAGGPEGSYALGGIEWDDLIHCEYGWNGEAQLLIQLRGHTDIAQVELPDERACGGHQ